MYSDNKRRRSFERSSEHSPLSTQIYKKYREYESFTNSSSDFSNMSHQYSPSPHLPHPTHPNLVSTQVSYATGGMPPPQFSSTPVQYSSAMHSANIASHQPQSGISDFDIQRLAQAVKGLMVNEIKDIMKSALQDEIQDLVGIHVAHSIAPLRATIENLASKNRELERRVDELEAYSRRNLVRISGVSEKEIDTSAALTKIASKLEIPMTSSDIEVSHRVGPKHPSRPRQIIARIKNYELRHRLLRSSKKLKQHPDMSGIHINQELSKSRGKLAYHARQLVRERKIKSTFVWDGKVIVVDNDDRKHTIQFVDELMQIVGSLGTDCHSDSTHQSPQVLSTSPTVSQT
ncbi:hypothetical protein FSP39_001589 [Pinctada imbricata]|uniref:Uncharacterized protein n=1 Tax=Pinctada imbricata TaxID=66713 RepID=A0AA88XKI3_PINIB|nr:hypothetical protein FSP39_001589 [Pinctada imbricata]